jgi:hypothetical protein
LWEEEAGGRALGGVGEPGHVGAGEASGGGEELAVGVGEGEALEVLEGRELALNSALETKTVRGRREQSWQPAAGSGSSQASAASQRRPSPQKARRQEAVQAALSAFFGPSSHSSTEVRRRPSPQVLRRQEAVQAALSALFWPSSHSSTEVRRRPSPQVLRRQEAVQAALSALFWPSSHSSPGSWAPSPQKGAVVVVEVEDEVVVAGEDVEAVVSVSVVSVVVVSVVVVQSVRHTSSRLPGSGQSFLQPVVADAMAIAASSRGVVVYGEKE